MKGQSVMVHKSGTLTNLELALFNSVALATLATCFNFSQWAATVRAGEKFWIGTPSISRVGGYSKLSSYHYKLLNRLCTLGYLESMWVTSRIKQFAVTKKGWEWLNVHTQVAEIDQQSLPF
jgi:hypothetical protein